MIEFLIFDTQYHWISSCTDKVRWSKKETIFKICRCCDLGYDLSFCKRQVSAILIININWTKSPLKSFRVIWRANNRDNEISASLENSIHVWKTASKVQMTNNCNFFIYLHTKGNIIPKNYCYKNKICRFFDN